jgi:hypothetical protein
MTWHSYRLATDIGALLAAVAMVAYCWSSRRYRPYAWGFVLIAGAGAGEVAREFWWPARGTFVGVSFTVIDLLLLAAGALIVMRQWRRERVT